MSDTTLISKTCAAFKEAGLPIDLGENGGGQLLFLAPGHPDQGMSVDIGPPAGGIISPDNPDYGRICEAHLWSGFFFQREAFRDSRIWNPTLVATVRDFHRRHGVRIGLCGVQHPGGCGVHHASSHGTRIQLGLGGWIEPDVLDLKSVLLHEKGHIRDISLVKFLNPRAGALLENEGAITQDEVRELIRAHLAIIRRGIPKDKRAEFDRLAMDVFGPVERILTDKLAEVIRILTELLRHGEEILDPKFSANLPKREESLLLKGGPNESVYSSSEIESRIMVTELLVAKLQAAGHWERFRRSNAHKIDPEKLSRLNQTHIRFFRIGIEASSCHFIAGPHLPEFYQDK